MMPAPQIEVDHRPVHIKIVQTSIGPRFCTVLPPGPIDKAELIQREQVHFTPATANSKYLPHMTEDVGLLQDYLMTKLDKR